MEAWQEFGLYPALRERAGLDAEPGALEGDRLRSLAVAGDPRDCARAIAELWAAGADSVALVALHDAHDEQLARFNEEVRPLL